MQMLTCRARRRYARGLKRKTLAFTKRLRKAKKDAGPLDKPAVVKTHLRDTIIVPEMVGCVVGVYSGKTFNQVEIKVSFKE
jgi:small subunit ribosomal protein S15e